MEKGTREAHTNNEQDQPRPDRNPAWWYGAEKLVAPPSVWITS
jgi:hypothetical protein